VYDKDVYWGLANVVLDVPPLLEEAGIYPMPDGLNLALADQSGRVFSGSEDVFDLDPVTYLIELPEGNWILAAIPSTGWGMRYKSVLWVYNGLAFATTIAISLIFYLFINRRERLAYQVEQRTEELALSNQTLINVLEGIDADVYVADIETHEILFANKHLRDSFNNNLLGKICYQEFRHEANICTHCMQDKLLDSIGEPTGVHKWEGQNPITKRWYKNADRAIRWQDGRYVHLQIATDITEQKQAEKTLLKAEEDLKALVKEKDILLAEVHHRVKNNMQVIISLLGLQASEIEDTKLKAVYEESRNRIKSMTLVHEQLYRSKEYAHIEIGTYIDQLATTLFNSYQIDPDRIQMQITAVDVYIDLERAIPCGLLLNELITNSLKYAFPSNANGHIWINLQPDSDNKDVSLIYRDDGIGLPLGLNLENSQSLGLQLVRLLAVHDLNGNVELKNGHKKGVKFLIKFPTSTMKRGHLDPV
jgi:two-component sensor histidine kinase